MKKIKKQINCWLVFFIVALFVSGLTAIPVARELNFLLKISEGYGVIHSWIQRVYDGFQDMNRQYPFLAYGYDWLAFAHFVLAILFIGPLKDPVKNKWVIQFGILACVLIIPYALIAGYYREIPVGWRLIDCSFGILGLLPLLIIYKKTGQLEKHQTKTEVYED
jgi:hypothetical protein